MVNKYFKYDNFELWEDGAWDHKASTIFELVKWIGRTNTINTREYTRLVDGKTGEDCYSLPCFDPITKGVFDPEVLGYWEKKGLTFYGTTQGNVLWIAMVPTKAIGSIERNLEALIVLHQENYKDPYWAMRTLEYYKEYNERIAADGDKMIIYFVTEGPDKNGIYPNIMQEAFTLYPGNLDKVYLDVSVVYNSGKKIKDIREFVYRNPDGTPDEDPDKNVKYFWGDVPALDISRRWENKYSLTRHQSMHDRWSCLGFDADKLKHTINGENMMRGIVLEHKYDKWDDPELLAYWDRMGLNYECHSKEGQRWITAVPKCVYEGDEKIPLLIIMQEVNVTNEHLTVTAASYYYELYKIAAQGDMMILDFVLESPDDNEFLMRILNEDAFKMYPFIDRERVYIIGQSHNGYFTYEFASRHADIITAAATFNGPCLTVDRCNDVMLERLKHTDLPVISMAGMKEMGNCFPINDDGHDYRPGYAHLHNGQTFEERYAGWQRRLTASRCPSCTREEMIATRQSPDLVTRMLGFPNDRSQVIYADGIEHYIADVKNVDGKYHLRIVGAENMPHNTFPFCQILAWSYLRNFSRDLATGEIKERY